MSTAIDYDSTAARIDTLVDVAEFFRLAPGDTRAVLRDVVDSVGQWQTIARKLGLGGSALEQLEPAFEHEQFEAAVRESRLP